MKRFKCIFIVLCMLLCVLPLAAMSFARTEATAENRKLATMPSIVDDNGFNRKYLQQLGAYFEDHFAGRNLMINIDSLIQGNVFGVSNASTVIKGTDGWLYYSDTLDDYLGKRTLSDRGIYNAAKNISVMQDYVTSNGARFLFVIPPNKNSLYGDNMPYYYSGKVSSDKNITRLTPVLKEENINYCDLFDVFTSYDETLYLKRDSHWNNKGALIAYNSMLDCLGVKHNDYTTVKAIREKKEKGDLNKMLYPLTAKPEWNYEYLSENGYEYVTDTQSVEEAWIETSSKGENGKLLMFRDSFGNTLIPFFAREFANAYFSKGIPYALESYIEKYKPDFVIAEKVERNIDEFAYDPPVITAVSQHKISEDFEKHEECASVDVSQYDFDVNYYVISGSVDEEELAERTDIYVKVNETVYDAYAISDANGDNGYRIYIKKDKLGENADISVFVCSDGVDTLVKTQSVDLSGIF